MERRSTDRPKRDEMVVINDEAEVPSLLHPMTGKIFLTNRVGTRVIQLANGVLTVEEIVGRIVEQYRGADRDVVSKEVAAFLEEGTAKGLILWEEGARP